MQPVLSYFNFGKQPKVKQKQILPDSSFFSSTSLCFYVSTQCEYFANSALFSPWIIWSVFVQTLTSCVCVVHSASWGGPCWASGASHSRPGLPGDADLWSPRRPSSNADVVEGRPAALPAPQPAAGRSRDASAAAGRRPLRRRPLQLRGQ